MSHVRSLKFLVSLAAAFLLTCEQPQAPQMPGEGSFTMTASPQNADSLQIGDTLRLKIALYVTWSIDTIRLSTGSPCVNASTFDTATHFESFRDTAKLSLALPCSGDVWVRVRVHMTSGSVFWDSVQVHVADSIKAPVDTTHLARPANVRVTRVDTTHVRITWSPAHKAVKYQVWSNPDRNAPGYSMSAEVTDTFAVHATRLDYWYYVVALDTAGNKAYSTDTVMRDTATVDTSHLTRPTNLRVSRMDTTRVRVAWSPAHKAVKYQVWSNPDRNVFGYSMSAEVTDTFAVHTTRFDYWYYVIAFDAAGNKAFSTDTVKRDLTADDTTKPAIKLFDPPQDSFAISANAKLVKVIVTDANGIAGVRFAMNTDTFPLTRTDSIWSANVLSLQVGFNTITITATDASTNKNVAVRQIRIKYDPTLADTIKPTIRLFDPPQDSFAISANAKLVKVIVTDANGIASVRFAMNADTFIASRADSVWSANVLNLQAGYNTITVTATDASANRNASVRQIRIKYDPTIADNTGPTIVQTAGPASNSRVETDTASLTFTISDTSGVDSVFFSLNGGTATPLTKAGANSYSLSYRLPKSGQNQIALSASDKSTNHNRSSLIVTLNLNRKPTCVTWIDPPDAAQSVECSTGVTLKWRGATDPDGDSLRYIVNYGLSDQTMTPISTLGDSVRLPSLEGDTMYKWFLLIVTALDTVRCPAVNAAPNTFTTRNHPSVISGFTDVNTTTRDTVRFAVTATDYEGIKEYRFDYDGDGIPDFITTTPTTLWRYAVAGVFRPVVTVVDKRGALTYDTAVATVIPAFDTTYGMTNADYGTSLVPLADSGCVAIGTAYGENLRVLRVDKYGNVVWSKVRNDQKYTPVSILKSQTGSFVLLTNMYDGAVWRPFLYAIDIAGNPQWTNSNLGGGTSFYATSLVSMSSGYKTAVCDRNGVMKMWNFAFDGTLVKDSVYDYPCTFNAGSATNDGMAAYVGSKLYISGEPRPLFVKVDWNGALTPHIFTEYSFGQLTAVTTLTTGDFIVYGSGTLQRTGVTGSFMIRLDPNGNTLWTKSLDGYNVDGLGALPGGEYAVMGDDGVSAWYARYNSNGDSLDVRHSAIRTTKFDAVTQTADGCIVLTGGNEGLWLTKSRK